ncbi:peptidase M50 [Oribacterium sp. C9]|uniref:M50 family metallopeptidase n=1 Tax=Oribacterium sp. C9 TaxID=1943579 RepID=UPI00098FF518|nr:site-2 protease family protein [Oribacterium sp. C9]OON85455.1 peptidase M50 [Oribacterium sp. C9]
MSIIVAILGLSFLIFFHELGHFLAAKICHVGVLEFSIGMGPRLISRVWKNTRYSLKLLPIGGSCAMLGEDAAGSGDFSTAEGKELSELEGDPIIDYDGVRFRKSEIEKYNFQKKPAPQRFFICIAGVLNNFILAVILAGVIVFFCGYDNLYVAVPSEGNIASENGFENGDAFRSIGFHGKGQSFTPGYRDLYIWSYVNSEDFDDSTMLDAVVIRNGEKKTVTFKPHFDETKEKYVLGLSFYNGRYAAGNLYEFLTDTFYEVRYNVNIVIQSLRLIAKGRVQRHEVMGPVGTVTVMGNTVERSTKYGMFNAFLVLLELLVMISSNLGIMNLLPIPALDGGRLIFISVEMLCRRKLDPSIEDRINQAGMMALLVLMALIMSNDIWNIFSGAYASFIGG